MSIILNWFRGLPLVVQSLIARSLLSAVVLSLWSHVATHVYALRYGARLPLEGVPFLLVFSVVAAIILSSLSAASLMFVGVARARERRGVDAGKISDVVSNDPQDLSRNDAKKHSSVQSVTSPVTEKIGTETESNAQEDTGKKLLSTRILNLTAAFATLLGMISAVISAWVISPADFTDSIFGLLQDLRQRTQFELPAYVVLIAFVAMVSSLFVERLFSSLSAKHLEVISIFVYVLSGAAIMLLMLGQTFDHLLRITYFGGGLPVEIKTTDNETFAGGKLFIVSTDTVTVWTGRGREFRQFSLQHVVSMTYGYPENASLPAPRSLTEILLGPQMAALEEAQK